MKAILYKQYGPPSVLEYTEINQPEPSSGEVLVKVKAAALNAADWRLMRGKPFLVRLMFGLLKPRRPNLGCDLAGTVEAVGSDVDQFMPGDEVYGDVSSTGMGAFREYHCVKQGLLSRKPKNLTFEESAAVPLAAMTALQGLRKGHISPGDEVLICGASGGVGTFAIQIAKALGARVTAVCSTGKVEMVGGLGTDEVIDYTQKDFASSGKTYDLILAVNGSRSLADYRKVLKPAGRYVMCGGGNRQLFEVQLKGPFLSRSKGQRFSTLMAKANQQDLMFITELIESGHVKPVIDSTYPLAGTAKAMSYLEEGHAKGKIVLSVST